MTAILPFSIEPAAPAAPARAEAVAPADAAAFGASLEQALLAAVLAQPQAKPVDQSTLAELARALMEFGGDEAIGAEEGEASARSGEAVPSPADGAALVSLASAPATAPGLPDASAPALAEAPTPAAASWLAAAPQRTVTAAPAPAEKSSAEVIAAEAPAVPARESLLNDTPETPVRPRADEAASATVEDRRTPAPRAAAAPEAEANTPAPEDRACSAGAPPIEAVATGTVTPDATAQAQQLAAAAQLPPLPSQGSADAPKPAPATTSESGSEARAAESQMSMPTGARAATAAADAAAALLTRRAAELPVPVPTRDLMVREAETGTRSDQPADATTVAADRTGERSAGEAVALGGAPLPAGVRVLELQAEAARRRTITGAGKREARTQPAPRTAEQAGAELQAGTAMPSVAAEAIEQLRRPAVGRTPDGRTRDEGSRRDSGIPTIPSARTTDSVTTPVLTLDPRDPDAKAAAEATAEGRSAAEPSLRQQAEQQGSGHALPAASAGHAGPATSGSSAMPRPVPVDGMAAPAATAPTEPLRPAHDRISVRLGDEVGAPVVRIDIRGEQVNARIVTPDAQLAQDLGRGVQELATALEARGFEGARVQVRGTAPAYEQIGPAHLAGSGIAESRSASETRSDDRHQAPEDRAQGWREAEAHERRQGRRPRRTYEDEEQP